MALTLYRAEEGQRVRGFIHAGVGALGLHGLYSLYEWLGAGWWAEPLPGVGTILGDELTIAPRLLICLAVLLGASAGLYALFNYKKWADFLIDTESELRKVSWASRRQVAQESAVVVATVLILGVYVFFVDMSLTAFQKQLPGMLVQSPSPSRAASWNDVWDLWLGPRESGK